jgi:hypothetical protein
MIADVVGRSISDFGAAVQETGDRVKAWTDKRLRIRS